MRRNLLAFLWCLAGTVVALIGWHLWDDHRLIDSIRLAREQQIAVQAQQMEQFRQQQQRAQPAAPSGP